jgi:hypothetical protein
VRLGYSLADLLHHCGEQLLPETEEDATRICTCDTEDSHLSLRHKPSKKTLSFCCRFGCRKIAKHHHIKWLNITYSVDSIWLQLMSYYRKWLRDSERNFDIQKIQKLNQNNVLVGKACLWNLYCKVIKCVTWNFVVFINVTWSLIQSFLIVSVGWHIF